MPLDPTKLGERNYKRQWKLMNRVGQLGRQGVRGPAEQSEKRILRTSKATKAKSFRVKRS